MRIGVIINPIAGRAGARAGTGARRAERARRWMDRAGVTGDVELTGGPGDAHVLAQAFADRSVDRVVAWGGDGTVNQAAGPLRETGVILGIVASGSGDGLARSLGLPIADEAAFRVAITGSAGTMDVGTLGTRHFLNVAGVGFDAAVACAFNQRRTRGALGYVTGGLTTVWTYRCSEYQLDLDGLMLTGSRFLVAFANGRQYGNGIVIAPDADPSDGWLNAVVVAEGSAIRQFWRARRLAILRLRPAEGVIRTRVRRAGVTGDRLQCHVDGETFEASGALAIGVQPGALRIAGLLPRRRQ